MKKQLFLVTSLAALSLVGCKKNIDSPNGTELVGNSDQVILLKTFGPTKAANAGVRDTLFLDGDQIGVTAAFTTADTLNPDWTKDVFFDNAPARFDHAGEVTVGATPGYADKRSYFAWGAEGQGGLKWNRYYPSKDVPVMLYAYYPYSASTVNYVKSDMTTAPQLKVTLNTDSVKLAIDTAGANVKQADVLHFATAKRIKRTDTLSLMTFKHALAQLAFRFRREAASSIAYIDTIEFCTVKAGSMDITTGKFSYLVDADPIGAKYIIIPEVGDGDKKKYREVPLAPDYTDPTKLLDIFAVAKAKPLMILPLEAALAKQGTLRIVINVSTDGSGVGPEFQKSMTVPLTALTEDLAAGKKHIFNILVTNSAIKLEAKIEPWDPNGTSNNFETE